MRALNPGWPIPLTLAEVAQIVNDLVDAGHGDKEVYVRDYFIRDPSEIRIENLGGVDYVCIGDA